ncbi:hypothetical protein CBR_g39991 [Chara braunii]|uniref:Uncharacterized protein n=1 Tax=Chara braunii TaxID=69332 RepID=A0A388LSP2_CHABU|nr:hypothetical protein CBR_g39991 [Chara braunii]|eukprot:GBG85348.1 hypothetical protein CBR_g39991 [Chara braunii]
MEGEQEPSVGESHDVLSSVEGSLPDSESRRIGQEEREEEKENERGKVESEGREGGQGNGSVGKLVEVMEVEQKPAPPPTNLIDLGRSFCTTTTVSEVMEAGGTGQGERGEEKRSEQVKKESEGAGGREGNFCVGTEIEVMEAGLKPAPPPTNPIDQDSSPCVMTTVPVVMETEGIGQGERGEQKRSERDGDQSEGTGGEKGNFSVGTEIEIMEAVLKPAPPPTNPMDYSSSPCAMTTVPEVVETGGAGQGERGEEKRSEQDGKESEGTGGRKGYVCVGREIEVTEAGLTDPIHRESSPCAMTTVPEVVESGGIGQGERGEERRMEQDGEDSEGTGGGKGDFCVGTEIEVMEAGLKPAPPSTNPIDQGGSPCAMTTVPEIMETGGTGGGERGEEKRMERDGEEGQGKERGEGNGGVGIVAEVLEAERKPAPPVTDLVYLGSSSCAMSTLPDLMEAGGVRQGESREGKGMARDGEESQGRERGEGNGSVGTLAEVLEAEGKPAPPVTDLVDVGSSSCAMSTIPDFTEAGGIGQGESREEKRMDRDAEECQGRERGEGNGSEGTLAEVLEAEGKPAPPVTARVYLGNSFCKASTIPDFMKTGGIGQGESREGKGMERDKVENEGRERGEGNGSVGTLIKEVRPSSPTTKLIYPSSSSCTRTTVEDIVEPGPKPAAPLRTNGIAIDLGTSSCAVAVFGNERVRVIPNEFGKLSTPSFIAFTDRKRLVGAQAQKQVQRRVENVLFEIKRLIGRDYDSITREERYRWPFRVARGQSGEARVEVKSEFLSLFVSDRHDNEEEGIIQMQSFTPEEVLSMLLAKMKHCAEVFLDSRLTSRAAVITVPASYDDRQRSATKLAAEIAGFADVELVSEPTAAALAYAHHTGLISLDAGRGGCGGSGVGAMKILVFALGGGSFDASLVTIVGGKLIVNGVAGKPSLGGKDFDIKIMELVLERGEREWGGQDLTPSMVRRLKTASEKAKQDLTLLHEAFVEIESFFGDDEDLRVFIDRQEFEHKCQLLVEECLTCVGQVLDETATAVEDVNEVLLVGGCTRIPMIASRLREFFGNKLAPKPHPYQDEAVVRGAALWIACRDRIRERHPLTIGYSADEAVVRVGEAVVRRAARGAEPPLVPDLSSMESERFCLLHSMFDRPASLDLPPVREWYRSDGSNERSLTLIERTSCTGRVQVAGQLITSELLSDVLLKLRIDRSGILFLDEEGSVSAGVSLAKPGRCSEEEVISCRERARKMTEYEMRMARISSARHRWQKFVMEVERRRRTCPLWLRPILSKFRLENEEWLEAVGAAAATSAAQPPGEDDEINRRFFEFREACTYAFGRMWVKSIFTRKPFMGDIWNVEDIDLCLKNLSKLAGKTEVGLSSEQGCRHVASRDVCDWVVCVRGQNLVVERQRQIEQAQDGFEVAAAAAPFPGSPFHPEFLRHSGIAYVLLEAVSPSAASDWCHSTSNECPWRGNNELVGQQAALAVHCGLLVILCIGVCSASDKQTLGVEGSTLEQEKGYCKAQLMDVLRHARSDWRNIFIAYRPSSIPITDSASASPRAGYGGGGAHEDSFTPAEGFESHVVETVRYIRGVISDEVSADAAARTRIAIRGRVGANEWNALFKSQEIDGLLLEGGFRDSLTVKQFCEPCRERNEKVFLCATHNGGLPCPAAPDLRWFDALSHQLLLNAEHRVFLLAAQHPPPQQLTPSFRRVTRVRDCKTNVMRSSRSIHGSSSSTANAMWKAQIFPISDPLLLEGQDAEDGRRGIETQLCELQQEMEKQHRVILEYRPASHEIDRVDDAHVSMRRWIWTNVSPEAAQRVYILCFVDEKVSTDMRQQIANLPNVDGLSWQLPIEGEAIVRVDRKQRGICLRVCFMLLVLTILYVLYLQILPL